MILAAGRGLRMRPLTANRPKALVRLGGVTLIDRLLDDLAVSGFRCVAVNGCHHADRLRSHLALRDDVRILFSDETDGLLGSGGGVLKALDRFGAAPFLTINGDSLFLPADNGGVGVYGRMAARLRAFWREEAMDALLLSLRRGRHIGFPEPGDYDLDADSRVLWQGRGRREFAYGGVQLVHPRLFAGRRVGEAFAIQGLWRRSAAAGRLFGLAFDGVWRHLGTPETLAEAESHLRRSEG